MPINPLIALQSRVPNLGDRFSAFADQQNALSRLARQDAITADNQAFNRRRVINNDAIANTLNQQRIKAGERSLAALTSAEQVQKSLENSLRLESLLKAGDVQGAIQLQQDRVREIQGRGGDPSHTLQTLQALQTNPDQVAQQVQADITMAERLGQLESASIKPPTTREIKSGQNVFTQQFNTQTGKFETIATAPRSSASTKIDINRGGKASAKTTLFLNGASIQARRDGSVIVTDPSGKEVSGQERLDVLAKGRKSGVTNAEQTSAARKQGSGRIVRAGKAADQVEKIRRNIINLGRGLQALKAGADTGPFMSRLPSFRQASITLDNVQKSLGLDVVQSTTFGALSKGELDLALSKALPTGLRPAALKEFIQSKIEAQTKLSNYLTDAAIFLEGGGTPGEFLKAQQELQNKPLTPAEKEELRKLKAKFGG